MKQFSFSLSEVLPKKSASSLIVIVTKAGEAQSTVRDEASKNQGTKGRKKVTSKGSFPSLFPPEVQKFFLDNVVEVPLTEAFSVKVCDASILQEGGIYVQVSWNDEHSRWSKGSARRIGGQVLHIIKEHKIKDVVIFTPPMEAPETRIDIVEGILLQSYSFSNYKKKDDLAKEEKSNSKSSIPVTFIGNDPSFLKAVDRLKVVHQGVVRARDLVNTPASDCTPDSFERDFLSFCKRGFVASKVLRRSALEKLNAYGIVRVGQGSQFEPRLLKATYTPSKIAKGTPHVGLVGKGVTFDSGGLSLKPAAAMEEMKMDMAGAAAVFGAFEALSLMKVPIKVSVFIPLVENMVSAHSLHPGDVISTVAGKSVEVLNTDAEGRLILADALTLAEKEGCDLVVNVATLTGACIVALGEQYGGLFSRSDSLAEQILMSASQEGELLARLPLAEEYRTKLKSTIADLKNIGNSWGGALSAALFLSEFISIPQWAHLDIAGPAFSQQGTPLNPKGATGFGVKTLVRLVESISSR
jgi:leucyl aminopeptidase